MKSILKLAAALLCGMTWIHVSPVRAEQGLVIVEITEDLIAGGGVFNVATYAAPRSMLLSDTGLKEAGLAAGPVVPKSDEIRIFSSRDVMNSAPLARIWLNERQQGAYWFITGGNGDASGYEIPEGAVVVIWTKVTSQPLTWKNVFR